MKWIEVVILGVLFLMAVGIIFSLGQCIARI